MIPSPVPSVTARIALVSVNQDQHRRLLRLRHHILESQLCTRRSPFGSTAVNVGLQGIRRCCQVLQ